MLKYDSKQPLVSLHIPRSGGTSLGLILQDWFQDGYRNHYTHDQAADPEHPLFPINLGDKYKSGQCVHGHFMNDHNSALKVFPDTKQFITLFRDPLSQTISLFYYQKWIVKQTGYIQFRDLKFSKPAYQELSSGKRVETDSLQEFVEKGKSQFLDFLPFRFTMDNYKELLNRHFVHVCCNGYYKNSVIILADKLGKKPPSDWPRINKGDYVYDLSRSTIEMFERQNQLEMELYTYSRSLNS